MIPNHKQFEVAQKEAAEQALEGIFRQIQGAFRTQADAERGGP